MPTKTELAMAAIETLRRQGKEVTLEAANELIEEKIPGQAVSKQLFYLAAQKLKEMAPAQPAPSAPSPKGDFDQFLAMVEMARALIEAAGGDREKVIRLVRTV